MRKLLIILGVPVDDLTMDEALARLEAFILAGRASGKSHQVATINADFVVNALHDAELRRILQTSDMATADGAPLVWGARLLGVPLAGRVTGADLVPLLAERAARQGYSFYLFGAAPGVACRAAEVLRQRYPGLRIVGVAAPPHAPIEHLDPAYLVAIRAAQPDVLLVALGNPKQEKWIARYAGELGVPVAIGVGGTLDLLAGSLRRAPRWMQRSGLEWLFRLVQEPRRLWKRYVLDFAYFGVFFVRQWWALGRQHAPPLLLPQAETLLVNDTAIISIHGRLDASNHTAFARRGITALNTCSSLIIDLSSATFLDSSALGSLLSLANRARQAGGKLMLAAVPTPISEVLALVRLDAFFETYADATSALAACQPAQRSERLASEEREYVEG